jgi:hypothetical protein
MKSINELRKEIRDRRDGERPELIAAHEQTVEKLGEPPNIDADNEGYQYWYGWRFANLKNHNPEFANDVDIEAWMMGYADSMSENE